MSPDCFSLISLSTLAFSSPDFAFDPGHHIAFDHRLATWEGRVDVVGYSRLDAGSGDSTCSSVGPILQNVTGEHRLFVVSHSHETLAKYLGSALDRPLASVERRAVALLLVGRVVVEMASRSFGRAQKLAPRFLDSNDNARMTGVRFAAPCIFARIHFPILCL